VFGLSKPLLPAATTYSSSSSRSGSRESSGDLDTEQPNNKPSPSSKIQFSFTAPKTTANQMSSGGAGVAATGGHSTQTNSSVSSQQVSVANSSSPSPSYSFTKPTFVGARNDRKRQHEDLDDVPTLFHFSQPKKIRSAGQSDVATNLRMLTCPPSLLQQSTTLSDTSKLQQQVYTVNNFKCSTTMPAMPDVTNNFNKKGANVIQGSGKTEQPDITASTGFAAAKQLKSGSVSDILGKNF